MSAKSVYTQVRELLAGCIGERMDPSSLERLLLLVLGIICAESVAPAAIAKALAAQGLSQAQPESIERQVRRTENDPEISAVLCVHPLARHRLCMATHGYVMLVLDPTTKRDRVVKVSINVWYRNRTLPLVWTIWPGNVPLEGACFWDRIAALLAEAARLLPVSVPVILLADRAFGTPKFIDLLKPYGWYYVIRVQGQTRYRDAAGHSGAVKDLVSRGGQVKLACQVFKKRGWYSLNLAVRWAAGYKEPLCIVSNLPCQWALLSLYRRRFAIEASFRHDKSYGWHLEQCQVSNLAHLERLLVGMALATWITLLVGTQDIDQESLSDPNRAKRRRRKNSIFSLGLLCLHTMLNNHKLRQLLGLLVPEPDPDDIRELIASLPPLAPDACDLQDVTVLAHPVRP